MKFKLIVIALLSVVIILGCAKKEEKKDIKRIINVKVQPVQKKMLRQYIDTIGSFSPNAQAIVSSEIDGIVNDVNVHEGMFVQKGQLLAQVNDADYKLEVLRSEAALKQAKATLENLKLELGRKRALFEEQLITRQQIDDLATRYNVAEYDVDKAKSALDMAKLKLNRTKIISPISGFIREKKISVGDFVRYGTPTFTIYQNNPLKLIFTVSEKDISKIKIGQDLNVTVDSTSDKEFKGKVSIIYPGLDEKTRSLQVEALVSNNANTLKPGQFAKVIIYTSQPEQALLVPAISLLYEGTNVNVFTVDDNKARLKKVKIGLKYGDLMQITEGLTEKDEVVYVGQQNLSEGVSVNVAR